MWLQFTHFHNTHKLWLRHMKHHSRSCHHTSLHTTLCRHSCLADQSSIWWSSLCRSHQTTATCCSFRCKVRSMWQSLDCPVYWPADFLHPCCLWLPGQCILICRTSEPHTKSGFHWWSGTALKHKIIQSYTQTPRYNSQFVPVLFKNFRETMVCQCSFKRWR